MKNAPKSEINSFFDAIQHGRPKTNTLSGIFDQLQPHTLKDDALLVAKKSSEIELTQGTVSNNEAQ